jgi:probable HAF family extracellular repeat protein
MEGKNMKKKTGKFSVLIVLGIFLISGITLLPTTAQVTVTITDLGHLGGGRSWGYAINDFGQVVGEAETASGDSHAFLWSETTGMIDLGTLGGSDSWAWDINSYGQVVGESRTSFYNTRYAFLITPEDTNGDGTPDLWNRDNDADGINDLMMDLGTLADGIDLSQLYLLQSAAYGINDLGQIVGESINDNERHEAFLWTPGGTDGWPYNPQMKALGGRSSCAYDINDAGQVVGDFVTASSQTHAFLWTETDRMQQIVFSDETGKFSSAYAINNLGWVVGQTNTFTGQLGAFLWTASDGIMNLGTLGGTIAIAIGINDLNQVVGLSTPESSAVAHAFLWEENEMRDLGALKLDCSGRGSLPSRVSSANDINMNGQIAGESSTEPDCKTHAVLFEIEEPVQSARDRIKKMKKKIQDKVDAGEMSQGHANSMKKKLDAAEKQLPDESSSAQSTELTALSAQMSDKDKKATINVLNAFINQVNAFIKAEILTPEEGQELIDDVNLIISELGG